ncbi:MAG: hypothetical protein ACI9OJ_001109, partial [Myxococcota bacterium]
MPGAVGPTMFVLALLTLASSAPTGGPPEIGAPDSAVGRPNGVHTEQAHQQIQGIARSKFIPNLIAYESLSASIVERLAFMDDVDPVLEGLDRLRGGSFTRALENTIPGFGWLTDAYDAITRLIGDVSKVKADVAKLRETAAGMAVVAKRYAEAPSNETFQVLSLGYGDARVVFDDASRSLLALNTVLTRVAKLLEKGSKAVGSAAEIPLVGGYAAQLESRVIVMAAEARAVHAVINLTRDAIARDHKSLAAIRYTLDSGHAHDAYVAAGQLLDQGRPGSAMAAYRDLREKWPDTPWAHKADRQLVELVTYLDSLHNEAASLRREVGALQHEVAKRPPVEIRSVERTHV